MRMYLHFNFGERNYNLLKTRVYEYILVLFILNEWISNTLVKPISKQYFWIEVNIIFY